MTANSEPRLRHIVIVELDSSMQRRNPELPHLYIANTVELPKKRFKQLQKGRGLASTRGTYLQLRQDLNPYKTGTPDVLEANRRLRKLKRLLTVEGYAINGDASKFHTYVVNLDPKSMKPGEIGYVYVGQTSHTPEKRYAIHKGPKPLAPAKDLRAKVVHKLGIGLNYELMNRLTPSSPVFTRRDALALEKLWANKLDKMGYRVEAGEATPGRHDSEKDT